MVLERKCNGTSCYPGMLPCDTKSTRTIFSLSVFTVVMVQFASGLIEFRVGILAEPGFGVRPIFRPRTRFFMVKTGKFTVEKSIYAKHFFIYLH